MRLRNMITRLYVPPVVAVILLASAAMLAGAGYQDEADFFAPETQVNHKEIVSVPLKNSVVIDNEYIKLTTVGVEATEYGYNLLLEAENKTETECFMLTYEFAVNGYMVEGWCTDKMLPHFSAPVNISFSKEDLETAGIECINDILVRFTMIKADNSKEVFKSDYIKLDTGSGCEQVHDDSGYLLYNENNFKLVIKNTERAGFKDEPRILLYIENNNNSAFICFLQDLKINDREVTGYFNVEMSPNTKVLAYIGYDELFNPRSLGDFRELEMNFTFPSLDENVKSVDISPVIVEIK